MKTNKYCITQLPSVAILSAVIALIIILNVPAAAQEGDEINIHNYTGHTVVVFLFGVDQVHLNEAGGVQFAMLNNGESAVAHVPNCKFSFLLVDGQDIWHAEFHDCNNTDITFTPDTGHAQKG
jgi:hypothetical protein